MAVPRDKDHPRRRLMEGVPPLEEAQAVPPDVPPAGAGEAVTAGPTFSEYLGAVSVARSIMREPYRAGMASTGAIAQMFATLLHALSAAEAREKAERAARLAAEREREQAEAVARDRDAEVSRLVSTLEGVRSDLTKMDWMEGSRLDRMDREVRAALDAARANGGAA